MATSESLLLRRAAESSDSDVAERAIADLAQLLCRDGKTLEAERLLRKTLKDGSGTTGAVAFSLACLLADQRRSEAEAFFLQALSCDDPVITVRAARSLGLFLTENRKLRRAKRLLRRRMGSSNQQASAASSLALADLVAAGGQVSEARVLLEISAKSANPYAVAEAEKRLANLSTGED